MVGPIQLSAKVIDEYRSVVDFRGRLPRSDAKAILHSFDIFFFPSTCEGSAGVIYEAAAAGLPILTTPNSGTHLRAESEEVVFADYDDASSIDHVLDRLASDRAWREHLGRNAFSALRRCDLNTYGGQLSSRFRSDLEELRNRRQKR
jgi:glycosyltransferase involved in cell wall biosynthesis